MPRVRATWKSPLGIILTAVCLTAAAKAQAGPRLDLKGEVQTVLSFVRSQNFDANNCAESLTVIYDSLLQADVEDFNLRKAALEKRPIVKKLWQLRVSLRERLRDFHRQNRLTRKCAFAARSAFRAARFIEEFMIDTFMDLPSPAMFEGGEPHTMVNPIVGETFDWEEDLRSGDVLLSRGNAYASAAIARLGQNDTQFSHLTLVHRDSASGELKTLESWIERGTLVRSFERDYLRDGHARVQVYRYSEGAVGRDAAETMAKLLLERRDAEEQPFPYDFKMDSESRDRYFCSEIVSAAYGQATSGKLVLPLFQSPFPAGNRGFREKIGIEGETGFLPGDLEIDPRFELVAEWRGVSKLTDTRLKDAVLTMMFRWMEDPELRYRLDPPVAARVKGRTAVFLRQWDWIAEVLTLDEKISSSMTSDAVVQFFTLNRVAAALHGEIAAADQRFRRERGRPMVPQELYEELESLRKQDLEGSGDLFHREFHPPRQRT